MAFLLGLDVGSSSVKAALVEAGTGRTVGHGQSPGGELEIAAPQPGWAEQHPDTWWQHSAQAIQSVLRGSGLSGYDVAAVGIAYQMHGLVVVDRQQRALRPAIIWCDSRAVGVGRQVLAKLGAGYCHERLLNLPGNFTAAKLGWLRQHEPAVYKQVHRAMLPGDYIAMRLTGECATTASGLSEGIFWDFRHRTIAKPLLDALAIDGELLPPAVPTFAPQGGLRADVAAELGLRPGIPVSYRAGDQPNNAFSLNVLQPGEVAATAGTSGVVYAVTDQPACDPPSRVNTFLHVNDAPGRAHNGVLLCINGTGILNSWTKRLTGASGYEAMNREAAAVPIGCDGLFLYPFGNGAERILENRTLGAHFSHIDFNRHQPPFVMRAAQEGIVFALAYGFEVLQQMGIRPSVIRAGHANMFLSPLFRSVFVNTLGVPLERYNTDGASGAARGAGIGAGIFSFDDAFRGLEKVGGEHPDAAMQNRYQEVYRRWKAGLEQLLAAAKN
jgi:xylulokinase